MKEAGTVPGISRRNAEWLWLASAFLAAFGLAFMYVLHHFYNLGGMRDSLWFSGLMDHNSWTLPDPPSVAYLPGISFFYTHLSPVFYLPNALSFVSPFRPSVWYAVWYGLIHALMVPAFHALARPVLPTAGLPLCALMALLFAFNGNAVMALQMPHFELLMPVLTVWLLALIATRRHLASVATLVLILTVREDAGFHVAALLLSAAAIRSLATRRFALTPLDGDVWRLGLMALAGSVLAVLIQKVGWGDNGMLTRNYIGTPPFAHMTPAVLQARWANLLHERSYLWLPFAIGCAWAAAARNPLLPIGFLAYLPWLALQFFAFADVMGTLSWYYAFPAITSLAWPLFAIGRDGPLTPVQRRHTALWMGALLLSTMGGQLNGRFICYPWELASGITPVSTAMRQSEAFMDALAARPSAFGRVALDTAVMALRPRQFQLGERAEHVAPRGDDVDTLVWFDPGAFDSAAWTMARDRHLNHRFSVPGTPIVVASRLDLLQASPRLRQFMSATDLLAGRTRTVHAHAAPTGGWDVDARSGADVAIEGPMVSHHEGLFRVPSVALAPGHYTLTATVHLTQIVHADKPLFAIWKEHPWAPGSNAQADFLLAQLRPLGNERYETSWSFEILDSPPADPWPRMVQLSWHQTGNASYTIEGWALRETSYP